MRTEVRRALMPLGLSVGQWAALLAPILGLLVFWLFAFKPAVTLYVLVVGLGMVLLKIVESSRLSFEVEELLRRKVHEYYTR